jgi:hypothetical protein
MSRRDRRIGLASSNRLTSTVDRYGWPAEVRGVLGALARADEAMGTPSPAPGRRRPGKRQHL